MGYCTTSDIQGRYKSLTFATGGEGVTATKVQSMIDLNSSKIDARIGKLYQTPVTGTEAVKVLSLVCIYFTVADLEPVLGQGARETQETRQASFYEMAESELRRIETGQTNLADATRKTTSTFKSGNVSNGVTATFRKDRRQW